MKARQKPIPSNGGKLQLIGFVLMALSLFGIVPFVINLVLNVLLSNPPENTTGLAIVNIGTLLSVLIGLIAGLCLALIGTRRKANYAKR
ncbi:MAG: hypothetical protein JWS12_521 [Candidatus Saccharibacteria bacterium]|nr:hypothetical protein [Candidatus Saccharibacteria bacterium]